MNKRACSWTITVTVDDRWIADGFNPDSDDFKDALMRSMLGLAADSEVAVTVTKAPTQAQIDAATDRVK